MKNNTQINNLEHKLKNRHLQMIAIGSVIGTGLFFGAAKSIALTGPSIILSYILGGIVMFIIMRALGEMSIFNPNSGSFSEYATKYINSYVGFIAGWGAWFEYTIVCMVELTATTFFLDYFFTSIPHWLICLVVLLLFMIINLMNVKLFGEFEFWFAGIKVLAIISMLFFSIYLIVIKQIFNHNLLSYVSNMNITFSGGALGFAMSLVLVIFSFGGTEFVSIAAGESIDPQKNIPKAINGVVIRILLFYILTMMAIICLYPPEQLSNNTSPFVDVFQKIGIPAAATIMNIVAITAALSAFNSCLYSSSRILYNLALNNNANIIFTHISSKHTPYKAVIFTSITILLTVLINYLFPQKALIYLLAIATSSTIMTWFIILITQLFFRYKHKAITNTLKFKLPLYPYSNVFAIIMLIFVLFIMTKIDDMKFSVYIIPLWLLILSIMYIIIRNVKSIK